MTAECFSTARQLVALLVTSGFLALCDFAGADVPVSTVHAFPSAGAFAPRGALIRASDGNFYGTTIDGGASNRGTVFRMTPDGIVTILHSFRGNGGGDQSDGANPLAGVIEGTDGNFYGTTMIGGRFTGGIIFRITPDGTATTLHEFEFAGVGPDEPMAELLQASDGNFYGTTSSGHVFRMTLNGDVTILHAFLARITSALIQATDGYLYGTTYEGGAGLGTIFRMTLTGDVTTLHAFSGPEGNRPDAALVQARDGNFYGTTGGGTSETQLGTIFKMTPDGTVTLIHAFTGGAGGAKPRTALVQAGDGNLYGTTEVGGAAGLGTVFSVTAASVFTVVHSFAGGADGARPAAPLTDDGEGNLYGSTVDGGSAFRGGVIYRLSGGVVNVLYTFEQAGLDGMVPNAVIEGFDRNLYGTTSGGGRAGRGTVFKLRADGVLTILHDFGGADGATPVAGVSQGADGAFYGTTLRGGTFDRGVLFRITADSDFAVLHSFSGGAEGAFPASALVQASDGNLYGTTLRGGYLNLGTIFRITTTGDLTVLHRFAGFIEGAAPLSGLVEGSDGNFYGTTPVGGIFHFGTVFRMTANGTVTTLHAFTGRFDGASPSSALIEASDGNFYGTTVTGGLADRGTIFKLTPSGRLSVIHAFTGADGAAPAASLLQGTDGKLYGTTLNGGSSDHGTIFKIATSGFFLSYHSFTGSDGDKPSSEMIESSDGNWFYGSALTGGGTSRMGGLVFRMFNFACDDTLSPSYSDGTLHLGFTLMDNLPSGATWSTWIAATDQFVNLWSVSIPYLVPPVSFDVPLRDFQPVGRVGILTTLATSTLGTICGDWQTVDTGLEKSAP